MKAITSIKAKSRLQLCTRNGQLLNYFVSSFYGFVYAEIALLDRRRSVETTNKSNLIYATMLRNKLQEIVARITSR